MEKPVHHHHEHHTYVLNSPSVNFYSPRALVDPLRNASHDSTRSFFVVYLSLGALNTVFTLARAFLFAFSGIQAGKRIHNMVIDSLSKVKKNLKVYKSIKILFTNFLIGVASVL